ncbi:MAG TPA: prolipoprotein diacylglyceryl transferase, partial [Porphyromonadaceae bacterium]|nr:prolipoprotein diacylglyceryl transferase [Porphyromonadaceae bacterium]
VATMIRMGNLFNHEIYGCATSLPWGFRFIQNVPSWRWGAEPIFCEPSHPTQLYEGICYLLTFILIFYLYWKTNARKKEGFLLGIFFICVFGSRFFVEFVKNNQEEFEEGMLLNMGQLLSIPFVLFGGYLVFRSMKREIVEYHKDRK